MYLKKGNNFVTVRMGPSTASSLAFEHTNKNMKSFHTNHSFGICSDYRKSLVFINVHIYKVVQWNCKNT